MKQQQTFWAPPGVNILLHDCDSCCLLLKSTVCLFAVIQSWSPFSPSTLTRPTASASSSTPQGNTSPQEVLTLWSACGTWMSWCVSAVSPGQSVCFLCFMFKVITVYRDKSLLLLLFVFHCDLTLYGCFAECVFVLNHKSYFRCSRRLDWPVRTLSFSHDGKMLASASEDHFIDIAEVETGQYDFLSAQRETSSKLFDRKLGNYSENGSSLVKEERSHQSSSGGKSVNVNML